MLLDPSMTIGQRFKHIRTEKGLSQAQLVDGICSIAVVSQIECDRKYPSAELWGKLADKLGVPLREIMGMQEKQMEASFQIEMIRVYIEKADYAHAVALIVEMDQRRDLLEHQRTELLVCHAECLIRDGKYEASLDVLLPFLDQQQAQQAIDDQKLCDTYNKLGNAFFKMRDFEKAYSAFEQGYRISKRLPEYSVVAARVAYNLGLTCNQLDYKNDAQRYLREAKEFFESVCDMTDVADTLFALAMATGNVEYLSRARTLYEGLNLEREANVAKLHFAYYIESQKDYHSALHKIDDARKVFERLGDVGMCTYSTARSALISIDHDDLPKAEEYLKQAEGFMEQMEALDDYLCAEFYRARALYNFQQKNYDQCILDSQTSSEMCAKMGLYAESAVSLQLSAEAYHYKGMNDTAFEVSKKAFELLRPRGKKI
ncbi:helix-turn-helix domain-containing protein [Tumebacillus permanentifrigoris]|uniref:Helix-turn-helix protein n=1 Tax=Tumebacillus permanentifrigoris TaxID=378543 RepID=A0A316DCJ4_9BACL|nr:helix-turn-helix transcriptional regulator [Tumebacillus permanentifrigoris]PWK13953.1 helix-turn-helix protein [Tumebacillus permanentifrigoris]